MMDEMIFKKAAIDALDLGAELLRRVLDDTDVVGAEREKYEWGLGLIESCISDMKDLPSVDAVQVVRCRDCKHIYCRTYQGGQDPIYTCTHFRKRWNTDFDLQVNPDDFCSYGERREE